MGLQIKSQMQALLPTSACGKIVQSGHQTQFEMDAQSLKEQRWAQSPLEAQSANSGKGARGDGWQGAFS